MIFGMPFAATDFKELIGAFGLNPHGQIAAQLRQRHEDSVSKWIAAMERAEDEARARAEKPAAVPAIRTDRKTAQEPTINIKLWGCALDVDAFGNAFVLHGKTGRRVRYVAGCFGGGLDDVELQFGHDGEALAKKIRVQQQEDGGLTFSVNNILASPAADEFLEFLYNAPRRRMAVSIGAEVLKFEMRNETGVDYREVTRARLDHIAVLTTWQQPACPVAFIQLD